MMKVAIVILNWNGQQMLADYLGQVVEYSKDEAEIIVADNGSTDDSVEWVRTHFPEVRIIQLDRNYGFAEGYNKALVQVDCTYYVLLNSDVEVTPHWLTPLIEEMDARPEVAACQPKILSEVRKDLSSMRELVVATSTASATRSAGDASSTRWRRITASTTRRRRCYGPRVAA